jgi:hypothetical protein
LPEAGTCAGWANWPGRAIRPVQIDQILMAFGHSPNPEPILPLQNRLDFFPFFQQGVGNEMSLL